MKRELWVVTVCTGKEARLVFSFTCRETNGASNLFTESIDTHSFDLSRYTGNVVCVYRFIIPMGSIRKAVDVSRNSR